MVHRNLPLAHRGDAHPGETAAVAIGPQHVQHRGGEGGLPAAVHDRAGVAAPQLNIETVVAPRRVQRVYELAEVRGARGLSRLLPLLPGQGRAVGHQHLERAARRRRQVDHQGPNDRLAVAGADGQTQGHRPSGPRPGIVQPDAFQHRGPGPVPGRDRHVHPLDRHRFEPVVDQRRQGSRDVDRGEDGGGVAGERLLEPGRRVSFQGHLSAHPVGRRAHLPIVREQGVQHRVVREQRREEVVVDDLEVEGVRPLPVRRVEGDADGHQARTRTETAADAAGTVLVDGAESLADGGDAGGDCLAREHRVHVGAGHRKA